MSLHKRVYESTTAQDLRRDWNRDKNEFWAQVFLLTLVVVFVSGMILGGIYGYIMLWIYTVTHPNIALYCVTIGIPIVPIGIGWYVHAAVTDPEPPEHLIEEAQAQEQYAKIRKNLQKGKRLL